MKDKKRPALSKKLKGRIPWNKGKTGIFSKETLAQMSESLKKRGIRPPSRTGIPGWNKGMKGFLSGERHYKWISDRSKLKTGRRHSHDIRYREWSKSVKDRDGWVCKIANQDCSGRLESHHILGWKDYPELRYEINNGITLCCFHHPRKRSEEERLSPYFKELVASSVKPL